MKKATKWYILLLWLIASIGARAQGLDQAFNPGTGASTTVRAISIQSDDKILIGGDFTSYNGTSINRIARLNADGTLDTSFDPGTGPNVAVQAFSIQSDGKILIGGNFTSYNGTSSINRIARLNADGTLDTSFDPGTGANNIVRAISVLSNGKILICGDFIRINFVTRSGLARLNADGTLDTGFTPGTVGGGNVLAISVTSADAFLIVGGFTTYDGTAINRIA